MIYVYMYINNQSNNIGLFITGVKCTIFYWRRKLKAQITLDHSTLYVIHICFFVTNNNRPQCSMFILLFYCYYYDLLNIVALCCSCFFLETVFNGILTTCIVKKIKINQIELEKCWRNNNRKKCEYSEILEKI